MPRNPAGDDVRPATMPARCVPCPAPSTWAALVRASVVKSGPVTTAVSVPATAEMPESIMATPTPEPSIPLDQAVSAPIMDDTDRRSPIEGVAGGTSTATVGDEVACCAARSTPRVATSAMAATSAVIVRRGRRMGRVASEGEAGSSAGLPAMAKDGVGLVFIALSPTRRRGGGRD